MKIVYISTAEVPSYRANSLQVMKVCQALVQIGEQVQLYLPNDHTAPWEQLEEVYGLTHRFPILRFPSRAFLRRFDFTVYSLSRARKEGAELVYTRMAWTALLARWMGFKTVLELHDIPSGRTGSMVYRRYLRARNPGLTVYITKALKDLADRSVNTSAREREYLIAPDGVDLERFESLPDPAKARADLGLQDVFTAVYAGGFYPGRGLEILEPLAQAFPQVQFLWIGGNDEQVSAWRERLKDRDIGNVLLTGFVHNSRLSLYQAAADVLLMPYSSSFGGSGGGNIARVSSPLKMFEYLASGRAILASDIPVLREVLTDKTACFYQPENFKHLCQQFSALVSNSALRGRYASAARSKAQEYDWKRRMKGILIAAGALSSDK